MAIITWLTVSNYLKKVYENIVAHDAVDSGDPNKIGGKASTAAPTAVSVGDRVNAWFDLNGRLVVIQDQALPAGTNNIGDVDIASALPAGTNNIGDVDLASAIPAGTNLIGKVGIDQTTPGTTNGVQINAAIPAGTNNIGDVDVLTIPALVAGTAIIGKVGIDQTTPGTTNGVQVTAALPAGTNNIGDVDVLTLPATNVNATALASAARTATVSSADLTNNSGKGIHVILDVTAIVNTPSITLKIEGKDALSGKYYTLLESAAVTGVSTNIYKVHPNLTASPNLIANDLIPKTFRITMTHADADSITYSVGYCLV